MKLTGVLIGALIVLGIIGFIVAASVVIVPAAHVGVVLTWGSVTGKLGEGLHFITPIVQEVKLIDCTIQMVSATEDTASQDLQEVTTTLAINYRVNTAFADELYKNLRYDYEARVIKPNIEESIKASTALFRAEELITKRSELKSAFLDILEERIEAYHVELLSVSIVDLQFSDTFTAAIEAKVTAEQRALEEKNKLVQKEYESQRQVIEAKAAAEKQIIEAEAYANATVIRAQAEAEALRLRREQLSPLLLQWEWMKVWDGELPYFYSGEELPMMILIDEQTVP